MPRRPTACRRSRQRPQSAFTLIELLMVIMIIAILSAIAVPSVLEFQVRAKVARVQTELRAMATTLEAYCVDQGSYPPAFDPAVGANIFPLSQRIYRLTTPIAYIMKLPAEVFPPAAAYANAPLSHFDTYDYYCSESDTLEHDGINSTRHSAWRLSSGGPDLYHSFSMIDFGGIEYDPTNGTISNGDLTRLGPRADSDF
ncbi:type IV pilin protein [Candidatus Sumerlaeota bacterium]